MMHSAILLFGLLAGATPETCDPGQVVIRGHIREANGPSLPGVTLALRGDQGVALTDAEGRFELCADARRAGVLVATRRGFEAFQIDLDLSDPPQDLRLEMLRMGFFETVDVTFRRALPEEQALDEGLQLSSLDVLRTAGAYADVFRRAQMLPGVSKIDEGAGLFVRGGDVDETATYLDRALLNHPYRLETPTGGFFGTVPPWLIAGMSLSTGGFPARYGNALSGVLELESLPRPEHREVMLSAGLAAISGRVSVALGKNAGLRLSGNRSQTRTLFELNNVDQEYSRYPASSDLNLGFYVEAQRLGRIEAFAFDRRNEVGLEVELESFRGTLASDDDNRGLAVRWQRALGKRSLVTLTASTDDFRQHSAAGVLDLSERERSNRLRLDVETDHEAWTLRYGAEWQRSRLRFAGDAPEQGGDLDGLDGTRLWQLDFSSRHTGAYLELERAFGRFELNLGLRADHHCASSATECRLTGRSTAVDPRLALTWTPRPRHRLRLASGLYSQAPGAQYLDTDFGNPELGLMRARHLVLGYAYREPSDPFHLRLELYDKDYDRLPLESPTLTFSNEGGGWARGVDLLVKAERGLWSGWMSASTIDSKRRWTRWSDYGRLPVPVRPISNGLATPYSLQLSSEWVLPLGFSLGGTFRWSTGRPFTPIVGAVPVLGDLPGEVRDYQPIYGELASDRYPDFRRLDLAASKSLPFLDAGLSVLYVGVSNVFDRQSTFRYAYSDDFSQRRPAQSSFGRSIYAGVTLIY